MDDLKTELIKTTAREGLKVLFTRKAESLGAEMVGREAARYAATAVGGGGAEAIVQAGTQYATTKATAQTLVKVAGPLAGAVSTPIIEVVLLAVDDEFHGAEEYVEAGMRGLISGAAGAVGGIALGAVPVVGPVAGPVASVAASYYVNGRLKESKALEGAAQHVVEVGENVAEVMSKTVTGAAVACVKGSVKIATFRSWRS
ncbi:hypothetical protein AB0I84_40065 [Streptomyces spectabilis]|uniref:hypothetical protein n=1 Tax=Streptomyces spectabilis TaxID=68270 RepID=UPI0033E55132